MNFDKNALLRLKEVLTNQLATLIACSDYKSFTDIAATFRYDDGREPGRHTRDHGLSLTKRQVEYLLKQADDIFIPPIKEDLFFRRWAITDEYLGKMQGSGAGSDAEAAETHDAEPAL